MKAEQASNALKARTSQPAKSIASHQSSSQAERRLRRTLCFLKSSSAKSMPSSIWGRKVAARPCIMVFWMEAFHGTEVSLAYVLKMSLEAILSAFDESSVSPKNLLMSTSCCEVWSKKWSMRKNITCSLGSATTDSIRFSQARTIFLCTGSCWYAEEEALK